VEHLHLYKINGRICFGEADPIRSDPIRSESNRGHQTESIKHKENGGKKHREHKIMQYLWEPLWLSGQMME
jgi:hypothetical protein